MAIDVKKLVGALKDKREKSGLSLRALSAEIGVSFSALARIERGEGDPDNNTIIRILNWLGPGVGVGEEGLSFEDVAFVHFRTQKNISSKTIRHLLHVANQIKLQFGRTRSQAEKVISEVEPDTETELEPPLAKSDMEVLAEKFRNDLGLDKKKPLDALKVRIEGVSFLALDQLQKVGDDTKRHLSDAAIREWSGMSVPLDAEQTEWVILLNDRHTLERQRVTYLEECWHIILGHQLTKIAKISDGYGRTYGDSHESEAYYLAAASMLPAECVRHAVGIKQSTARIATNFGTSEQLVEFRIKRLGLWAEHKGKQVSLT